MASLADIPFYGGYLQKQALNREQEAHDLKQTVGQMGLLAQMQQQQEMAALKPIMQQAGGDPRKAIQALLASGNPAAIALAAKLHSFVPAPKEEIVVPPGSTVLGPDRQPRFTAPERPAAIGSGGLRMPGGEVIPPAARPEATPKTLVNPSYPISDDKMQPHFSRDGGATWTPVPNTQPVARFAKQVPGVVVQQPRANPIVNSDQGIFERTSSGLVPLRAPGSEETLRPPSLVTSGNQQALRLRSEYNTNPEVKLANMLEPRVRPTAEYVASVGKGMGNPVGDAELVKLWLMTTHPRGDQIGQMDYRQIQALPDLWGRVKNVAGNFAFGKTLDSDTRSDMWKSIAEKYKATDSMRGRVRGEITRRARTMGVNEQSIFSAEPKE